MWCNANAHPLAQLVGRGGRGGPETFGNPGRRVLVTPRPVGGATGELGLHVVDEVGPGGDGHLLREPGGRRGGGDLVDVGRRRAEGGLQQQPCRALPACQHRGAGQRRGRPGQAQRAVPVNATLAGHGVQAVEGLLAGTAIDQGAGHRRQHRDGGTVGQVVDVQVAVLAVDPGVVGEHHVDLDTLAQRRRREGVTGGLGLAHFDRADDQPVHAHLHHRSDTAGHRPAGTHRQLRRGGRQGPAPLGAAGHQAVVTRGGSGLDGRFGGRRVGLVGFRLGAAVGAVRATGQARRRTCRGRCAVVTRTTTGGQPQRAGQGDQQDSVGHRG
jgi:hypothetical protein